MWWWTILGAALTALTPVADTALAARADAVQMVHDERAVAGESTRAARPGRLRRQRLAVVPAGSPVQGRITSGFGIRRSLFGAHVHRGIDIAARPGTPIRAPAAGKVIFAGWRTGYGRTLIIDHGRRIHTLYAHLSRVRVRPDRTVERGTVIARTGATGLVSGPHLHYEVLVRGRPVDPRRFAPLLEQTHGRVVAQRVRAR